MEKTKVSQVFGVILALVIMVVLIVLVIIKGQNGEPQTVKIETNPGTKVFAKLPGGEEQFLDSVSRSSNYRLSQIQVDVPSDADLILRFNNEEEIIAFEEWREEKAISVRFNDFISVQINAKPWALVYIKLPDSDDFIEPREQDFIEPPEPGETRTNFTPIRGGLRVPIGTAIKLVYQEKEKVFPYQVWKTDARITHTFSNP